MSVLTPLGCSGVWRKDPGRIELLERAQGRVEELEDRLDFAERLLARASESGSVQHLPGDR